MIKTTAMFIEEFRGYASMKIKLSCIVQKGECVQIVRGLYESDKATSAHLLARSIYGPSYISFAYALSYYGLIPEAVYTVTCASFDKRKKKKYETPFGTFTYRNVPPEAFPLCVKPVKEGNYWYRIAALEKALCDELYTMPPVGNLRELSAMLFDDLRIDRDELRKLNPDTVDMLSGKYNSTNIKKLASLLWRMQTGNR